MKKRVLVNGTDGLIGFWKKLWLIKFTCGKIEWIVLCILAYKVKDVIFVFFRSSNSNRNEYFVCKPIQCKHKWINKSTYAANKGFILSHLVAQVKKIFSHRLLMSC